MPTRRSTHATLFPVSALVLAGACALPVNLSGELKQPAQADWPSTELAQQIASIKGLTEATDDKVTSIGSAQLEAARQVTVASANVDSLRREVSELRLGDRDPAVASLARSVSIMAEAMHACPSAAPPAPVHLALSTRAGDVTLPFEQSFQWSATTGNVAALSMLSERAATIALVPTVSVDDQAAIAQGIARLEQVANRLETAIDEKKVTCSPMADSANSSDSMREPTKAESQGELIARLADVRLHLAGLVSIVGRCTRLSNATPEQLEDSYRVCGAALSGAHSIAGSPEAPFLHPAAYVNETSETPSLGKRLEDAGNAILEAWRVLGTARDSAPALPATSRCEGSAPTGQSSVGLASLLASALTGLLAWLRSSADFLAARLRRDKRPATVAKNVVAQGGWAWAIGGVTAAAVYLACLAVAGNAGMFSILAGWLLVALGAALYFASPGRAGWRLIELERSILEAQEIAGDEYSLAEARWVAQKTRRALWWIRLISTYLHRRVAGSGSLEGIAARARMRGRIGEAADAILDG